MTQKRGRKSTAELSVLTPAPPAPDAPYHVDDEAAAVWRSIVDAMPAHWFPPESFDTLANYCRHVVTARFISREIDRFKIAWLQKDGGPERLKLLCSIRDKEVRGALATARALRMTQQSRLAPGTARTARQARPSGMRVPWE